mgnify:FL=1
MKTVGIIAEYNPFHNGHAFQLAKAKEITGADYAIVVMSGNFVQRGFPAIMEKSLRTEAALLCGADVVIELPVHYASASAEYFASGAVSLLDRLGVVDFLCFGSECGDINVLSSLADMLLAEDNSFRESLKSHLKKGASYPQARCDALLALSPQNEQIFSQLNHPNNILGIEYLKMLKKRNSRIIPATVARTGSAYHEKQLNGSCSSALAIRETITNKNDIASMEKQVPPAVYRLMAQQYQKTFPIVPEDYSAWLSYKLLQEQDKDFSIYFDIDRSLSDRLHKFLPAYTDFSSFCEKIKTRNVTYTKVSRALLHILLNIYQEDVNIFCAEDYVYYAKLLGFRKTAAPLMNAMKKNASLPLISRPAEAKRRILCENGSRMFLQDIQASHLYALSVEHKFRQGFQNELQKKPLILP